jgi:hypothetical protein
MYFKLKKTLKELHLIATEALLCRVVHRKFNADATVKEIYNISSSKSIFPDRVLAV